MFKLATQTTYWWPVKFQVPSAAKPGAFDSASFEAQLRFLSNDEHKAFMEKVSKEGLTDRQCAALLVTDFRGIEDEGGAVVAFSAAELDKLTNINGVDTAIVKAYFDSRKEAPAKN